MRSALDLEEITPNHFIVHNQNAYSVLRGEGEQRGTLFELTTWRRDGLLARLATRGYRVLTLDGRLDLLPLLPEPHPLGDVIWHSLNNPNERYSVFDGRIRDWQASEPVERGTKLGVTLRPGQVVRKRKGRGAAAYFVAFAERNGTLGLRPIDETAALLAAYAQSSSQANPIAAQTDGNTFVVPRILLPQQHRDFLRRVATEDRTVWRVTERGWPYAVRLFERLGLRLVAEQDGGR